MKTAIFGEPLRPQLSWRPGEVFRKALRLLLCALLLSPRLFAQQPSITSFTPAAGTGGDTILVSGTGFSVGNIQVYFWKGVPGGVTVRSDTTMDVVVPSGAVTGALGIQRDNGVTNYTGSNFIRIGSGPYVTGFDPPFGPTNELVTISGVHFGGVAVNGVKFNGKPAIDAYPAGDGTSISVHVPYGATSGPITVSTPAGTSNSPAAFTVLGPGPYVTGFSPIQGSAGTQVLIDGLQLGSATGVKFNGVSGTGFEASSETLVKVTAPSGVTTGPLTVLSPMGNYTTLANFYVQPSITNVSPASGRAGTNVTITGLNFQGATAVTFNDRPAAAYTVVNNNTIQATVPAGATTGLIRVTTPPNSSCFSANNFVIKPTIYGFSPYSGSVGSSIVVTGANLNVGTPTVKFNGVQAPAPTGVSFGSLTVAVPQGATTGPITITNIDGNYTTSTNFFLPATISSFSPTNSPAGTPILVRGENLIGASQVLFNGVPAPTFTVHSNTALTVTTPGTLTTGPVKVTTPAGTATSSGLYYGFPAIGSFAPAKGLPGTSVTILGTNFLGTRAVRFNGLTGSVTSSDNGRIVAVVPSGAQTGPISVDAPAGTYTTTTNFVLDYNSDLEVWMTNSPAIVTVGSNVVVSMTMVNRGPFDSANVFWTNSFPSSFVIDSVTVDAPAVWSCAVNGSTIIASSTNAVAGGSSTMLARIRPQSAGSFVAVSSIWGPNTDYKPWNNNFALMLTVDPLPVLSARYALRQVTISWPAALTNFVLQSNPDLAVASGWQTVTNVPEISGSQKFIVVSNAASRTFYRLKK